MPERVAAVLPEGTVIRTAMADAFNQVEQRFRGERRAVARVMTNDAAHQRDDRVAGVSAVAFHSRRTTKLWAPPVR